ncbi:hypothetical protein BC828DRAFT_392455 [Blastocladiella britannica]|nr:hypothetical protein BC828DRAFT_392455 [Blastocladiella britannica]
MEWYVFSWCCVIQASGKCDPTKIWLQCETDCIETTGVLWWCWIWNPSHPCSLVVSQLERIKSGKSELELHGQVGSGRGKLSPNGKWLAVRDRCSVCMPWLMKIDGALSDNFHGRRSVGVPRTTCQSSMDDGVPRNGCMAGQPPPSLYSRGLGLVTRRSRQNHDLGHPSAAPRARCCARSRTPPGCATAALESTFSVTMIGAMDKQLRIHWNGMAEAPYPHTSDSNALVGREDHQTFWPIDALPSASAPASAAVSPLRVGWSNLVEVMDKAEIRHSDRNAYATIATGLCVSRSAAISGRRAQSLCYQLDRLVKMKDAKLAIEYVVTRALD